MSDPPAILILNSTTTERENRMTADIAPATTDAIRVMRTEAENTQRGTDFQTAAQAITTEVEALHGAANISVDDILTLLASFEAAARRLRNKVEMMDR